MPTGTVWPIGGLANVTWNVRNNHGSATGSATHTTLASPAQHTRSHISARVHSPPGEILYRGAVSEPQRQATCNCTPSCLLVALTSRWVLDNSRLTPCLHYRDAPNRRRRRPSVTIVARAGGGYSYRLCPRSEPLTEQCFQVPTIHPFYCSGFRRFNRPAFQRHPLDFVLGAQSILFPNGSTAPIAGGGTFVNTGTSPEGSMWARLPVPATGLGPRCLPGPNDTAATPHACEVWEGRSNFNGHVDGPCVPCPETAGSDCSRCSNPGKGDPKHPHRPPTPRSAFAPPFPGVEEAPQHDVLDQVKVGRSLSEGGGRWVGGSVGRWVGGLLPDAHSHSQPLATVARQREGTAARTAAQSLAGPRTRARSHAPS